MDDSNPYAPPESELNTAAIGGVWRRQKLVVMQRGAEFPDRCIHCNEVAEPGKEVRIHYLNIWLRLALIVFFLAFNVFALIPILIISRIFRKTAKLKIPLCQKHRRKRFWITVATVVLLIASIALSVISAKGYGYDDATFQISVVIFIVAFILAVVRGQLLRAKKIDQQLMIFRGAKPPFLDSLPEYSGP